MLSYKYLEFSSQFCLLCQTISSHLTSQLKLKKSCVKSLAFNRKKHFLPEDQNQSILLLWHQSDRKPQLRAGKVGNTDFPTLRHVE